MRIQSFIDTKHREYADYDNQRKIPNLMDGLGMAQRKIIYTALEKLAPGSKLKVAQLGMLAAGFTHYLHGEDNIIDVVTGLAQNYPGANNIPLLDKCEGQFGTRIKHMASSPRYIYTKLSSDFHKLFKKEDLGIVEEQHKDGDVIEPKFFIPIVPTLLVNGSDGTGNGFRSFIYPHNIVDIKNSLIDLVKGREFTKPLVPFLENWKGTTAKTDSGQVSFTGVYRIINTTTIEITELPPKWELHSYKAHLNSLMEKQGKDKDQPPIIKDYENSSTEEGWKITIDCPRILTASGHENILKVFNLVERMTETFVCWDTAGKMRRFASPEELLKAWYEERIPLYAKSIAHQIDLLEEEISYNKARMTYIQWCIKYSNALTQLNKADMIGASTHEHPELNKYMDRLIEIQIYKLTADEIQKQVDKIASLEKELDIKRKETPQSVMLTDLGTIK